MPLRTLIALLKESLLHRLKVKIQIPNFFPCCSVAGVRCEILALEKKPQRMFRIIRFDKHFSFHLHHYFPWMCGMAYMYIIWQWAAKASCWSWLSCIENLRLPRTPQPLAERTRYSRQHVRPIRSPHRRWHAAERHQFRRHAETLTADGNACERSFQRPRPPIYCKGVHMWNGLHFEQGRSSQTQPQSYRYSIQTLNTNNVDCERHQNQNLNGILEIHKPDVF
jgi:hypothetical protein